MHGKGDTIGKQYVSLIQFIVNKPDINLHTQDYFANQPLIDRLGLTEVDSDESDPKELQNELTKKN